MKSVVRILFEVTFVDTFCCRNIENPEREQTDSNNRKANTIALRPYKANGLFPQN